MWLFKCSIFSEYLFQSLNTQFLNLNFLFHAYVFEFFFCPSFESHLTNELDFLGFRDRLFFQLLTFYFGPHKGLYKQSLLQAFVQSKWLPSVIEQLKDRYIGCIFFFKKWLSFPSRTWLAIIIQCNSIAQHRRDKLWSQWKFLYHKVHSI